MKIQPDGPDVQKALKDGRVDHPVFSAIMNMVNDTFRYQINPLPILRQRFPGFNWERIVVRVDGQIVAINPSWQYVFESESSECHLDDRNNDEPTIVVATPKDTSPSNRYYFTAGADCESDTEDDGSCESFMEMLENAGFIEVPK